MLRIEDLMLFESGCTPGATGELLVLTGSVCKLSCRVLSHNKFNALIGKNAFIVLGEN